MSSFKQKKFLNKKNVIDIFTKYAWAIPLKNKSGLSITNGFKIVLSEHPQGGSGSPQGGFED